MPIGYREVWLFGCDALTHRHGKPCGNVLEVSTDDVVESDIGTELVPIEGPTQAERKARAEGWRFAHAFDLPGTLRVSRSLEVSGDRVVFCPTHVRRGWVR